MRIEPLAMPTVNWSAFNHISDRIIGEQITKELDRSGVKLDSPAALAQALTFGDSDTFKHRLDHVHVSFIGFVDHEELLDLVNKTSLYLATCGGIGKFRSKSLIVLTGNINQWTDACVAYCSPDQDYEMRQCFNEVFMQLQRQGFKKELQKYSKKILQDETFILGVN